MSKFPQVGQKSMVMKHPRLYASLYSREAGDKGVASSPSLCLAQAVKVNRHGDAVTAERPAHSARRLLLLLDLL